MSDDLIVSRAQRYILANQHRILELLDSENAEKHRRRRLALEEGYALDYQPTEVWDDKYGLSVNDCHFVIAVMAMFETLKRDFTALDDRGGLTEDDVRFPGFDQNTEATFLGYAQFLIDGGTFQSLASRDYNSHCPMLATYRRMLTAYDRNRLATAGHTPMMSAEHLREILASAHGEDGQGTGSTPRA